MPLANHPTSGAHIHADALLNLVQRAGIGRCISLASHFRDTPLGDGTERLSCALPGRGTVSLTQVTGQVTFRRPGAPLRHLPLPMPQALLWAAAWCLTDPTLEQAALDLLATTPA